VEREERESPLKSAPGSGLAAKTVAASIAWPDRKLATCHRSTWDRTAARASGDATLCIRAKQKKRLGGFDGVVLRGGRVMAQPVVGAAVF